MSPSQKSSRPPNTRRSFSSNYQCILTAHTFGETFTIEDIQVFTFMLADKNSKIKKVRYWNDEQNDTNKEQKT